MESDADDSDDDDSVDDYKVDDYDVGDDSRPPQLLYAFSESLKSRQTLL